MATHNTMEELIHNSLRWLKDHNDNGKVFAVSADYLGEVGFTLFDLSDNFVQFSVTQYAYEEWMELNQPWIKVDLSSREGRERIATCLATACRKTVAKV